MLLLATILTALLPSFNKSTTSGPLFFVAYANVPPTSSTRSSRFNRKRNKQRYDGLTLGDLESMQQSTDNAGDGSFIPTDASIFGQQREQRNEQANDETSSSEQSSSTHQLRRSLRRINLDLSGRVMCHVLSPKIQNGDDDDDDDGNNRATVQMNSMPLFQIPEITTATSSRFVSNKALSSLQRHIPHIYIGANYDLDEIWYGATRWIAKCSWQLPQRNTVDGSSRTSQLVESIFPTTTNKRSAWMLDLEREQSVFEHSDSTMRVSLVQHHSRPTMQRSDYSASANESHHHHSPTFQKLSMEYDSAKCSNDIHLADNHPTLVTQAPTISVNIQTPILHRRIELHTKKTWIVQGGGGDKHGNYYGGSHYGSYSPMERRLESIREGYRDMVPRSHLNTNSDSSLSSSSSSSTTTTTKGSRLQTFGSKLSHWLEEDGWMPKRVTTDLMGNLVSVNEVGFSSETSSISDSSSYEQQREQSATTAHLAFFPPMDNMGIRLRISKRIDWTSLGIFPWSNNNNNNNNNNQNNYMNSNQRTSTRVRLDLCGLHNSGNSVSQIGCHFDPLHLENTFKVVIGHDCVR